MENGGKKMVVMMLKGMMLVVLVLVLRPVSVVRLWSAGDWWQGQPDIVNPVPLSISASEKTHCCNSKFIPFQLKSFSNLKKQLIRR